MVAMVIIVAERKKFEMRPRENVPFVPRLCGGVFLSLLEAAKKSTPVIRKQFGAEGSGISLTEMLTALVRLADPSRIFPAIDNLKASASKYRKCAISKAGHFPFADQGFIATFTDRMKQHYGSVLADMQAFVLKFFDAENVSVHQRLVRGLLEIIQMDDTISDTDQFIYAAGIPLFKSAFCNQAEYELSSFLLAVWFFIVQERPDNSVGECTFLTWHTKTGDHTPWKYTGNAGETITRQIAVRVVKPAEAPIASLSAADDCAESNAALSRTKDVERVNDLWVSVHGKRLDPIKKEDEIAPSEMGYVYPLFEAYGDNLKRPISSMDDLTPLFQRDLEVRRQHFYDAETVRLQGEQALGSIIRCEFDDLKNDILSSVWNIYMDNYDDGFKRMKQVMIEASKANCTKGNLVKTGWIGSGEKQGIGHMLAAEKQLVWVVDDNA